MKRKGVLLLLIFSVVFMSAQNTKVYLGLGGMYSSFQDSRFSDIQFNKLSVVPDLGFSRISDKNYWHLNAYGFVFYEPFPKVDTISYTKLGYNVSFGYLRNLKPSFYLGVNWDVVDYYKRQTNLLHNGADSYKLSSDLYVSGKYLWDYNNDFQFNFGVDYGMFSFVNTEPSFSANFQQNIIDNGQVSFMDEEIRRPWNLQNMEFKGFWNQFNLHTSVQVDYKRRLSLKYIWEIRSFADNKGYPVTDARHRLSLMFNFINHNKTSK